MVSHGIGSYRCTGIPCIILRNVSDLPWNRGNPMADPQHSDKTGKHKKPDHGIAEGCIWNVVPECCISGALFVLCRTGLSGIPYALEVAGSGVYLTQMFQLFSPADGTNLLQGTAQGEMSLSVGLTLLAGVLIFLVQLVTDDAENVAARMGKHCLCYGVLCLLLASWICPWDKLQELPVFSVLAQSLQFAWRFLSPATLFLCAVSSVSVVWLEKKSNRFTVYGVILSLVIVSTCYYFDRITHDMAQSDDKMWLEGQQYSDGMYMYWEGNKFRALQLNYQSEDNAIKTAKGSAISYRNLDRQGNRLRFFLEQCGDADDYLVFPIYYYPGYEVRINGKITEGQVIDTRVACNMPQQPAEVMIRYKERPLFVAADLVSLFTVAAILWKKCLLIFHVAKKP